MKDEYYMKLALKLAAKGRGYASPNPMVGAVLVKKNRIIGQGYHKCCGEKHAEVNSIESSTENVEGSTLYVTLEPCCHHGKTPPCTDLIIGRNIKRVVIGSTDSNPLVSCQGVKYMQEAGIEVKTGVLEDECRDLNEVFFHFMETGLPFVTVKYAQTIDGRIATSTGQSQWISSPDSLKFAHRLRAEHDAILVGIGTVLKDNPALTVRHVRGRNPLRVIMDSNLAIAADANVVQNLSQIPTLIATTKSAADPALQSLARAGVEILRIPPDGNNHASLKELLPLLAGRNITSLLIEGGAQIITSALKEDLANRLVTVIAPKIIGKGVEAVGDLNIRNLKEAKLLSVKSVIRKGADVIIDSRLTPPSGNARP